MVSLPMLTHWIASESWANQFMMSDMFLVSRPPFLIQSQAQVACPPETISHPDSRDMTCVSVEDREKASTALEEATARFPSFPDSPLNGLRIGLPRQSLLPKPHVQVQTSLLRHLRGLGATLYSVDLPSMKMALPAYYVLASAEASSNLGRYGGAWFGWDGGDSHLQDETGEERRRTIRSSGFGLEVKKRLIAGTWALSAELVGRDFVES